MVGYVKHQKETWADMHQKIREKLKAGMQQQNVFDWADEVNRRKHRLQTEIAQVNRSNMTSRVALWNPMLVKDGNLSMRLHRHCEASH